MHHMQLRSIFEYFKHLNNAKFKFILCVSSTIVLLTFSENYLFYCRYISQVVHTISNYVQAALLNTSYIFNVIIYVLFIFLLKIYCNCPPLVRKNNLFSFDMLLGVGLLHVGTINPLFFRLDVSQ